MNLIFIGFGLLVVWSIVIEESLGLHANRVFYSDDDVSIEKLFNKFKQKYHKTFRNSTIESRK